MTKVEFEKARPKCTHSLRCTYYRTAIGSKPICELTDAHLKNIVNTFKRNDGYYSVPHEIRQELATRGIEEKYFSELEDTNDVIHGYKVLSFNVQADAKLYSAHGGFEWWSTRVEKKCMYNCDIASDTYLQRHYGETGCGLYFYRNIRPAINHLKGSTFHNIDRVDRTGFNVLVECVLFGTVRDVVYMDFSDEVKGYISTNAKITNIWVPWYSPGSADIHIRPYRHTPIMVRMLEATYEVPIRDLDDVLYPSPVMEFENES